jgi:hypothetical protein
MRLNSLFDPALDSASNRFGFLFGVVECLDLWVGAVEYRYSATPVLRIPVNIGQSGVSFGFRDRLKTAKEPTAPTTS